MSSSWCTIESDPGVFTELIQMIGVKGIQVEELYSLDVESLKQLEPVYGLIFLFKWRSEKDDRPVELNPPENLFFAQQVITNACATQAILSVLMNLRTDKVELGKELENFKEFTQSFSPEMKGVSIGNCEIIRKAHNSFARPEPFELEEKPAKDDSEVFHFITYVPVDGILWELDGLKKGPINLGKINPNEDWLEKVVPEILKRIQRYSQNEIKFSLMAVIHDRKELYTEEYIRLNNKKEEILAKEDSMSESEKKMLEAIEIKMDDLKEKIKFEEQKYQNWKNENVRRRHNYIPFLVNLLRVLAEKKELIPLVEKAKAKQREQQKKEEAKMDVD